MQNSEKLNFYHFSFEDFEAILEKNNFNRKLTKAVFDHYYKNKAFDHSTLPPHFLEFIQTHFTFELPKIDKIQNALDGTVKFLIEFKDQNKVECVLIPFFKKYTVCLSSQVGCAMNCSFCYTGTQGLKRNLSNAEIIMQYLVAIKYVRDNLSDGEDFKMPNIVFMGQGEPLHNFEALKNAISLLTDKRAFHLGPRQITVSSAGYIPGLKRFNELNHVNLAISFHSAKNEIRDELIPINKKYPIEMLLSELENIPLLKRQFITFEYLLIDEVNNSKEDALKLINELKLTRELKAIVNIIPFNPFPGSHYKRPDEVKVNTFKDYLVKGNIRTMVRTTKGEDILAACGQLNSKK